MNDANKLKQQTRERRRRRIRAKVAGTAERPRLSVFRSDRHISAQIIDDSASRTLAAASDAAIDKKELAKLSKEGGRKAKVAVAFAVGKLIAEKAKKAGVTKVVFDRGGFAYTGRVAALAEGARDNGLQF